MLSKKKPNIALGMHEADMAQAKRRAQNNSCFQELQDYCKPLISQRWQQPNWGWEMGQRLWMLTRNQISVGNEILQLSIAHRQQELPHGGLESLSPLGSRRWPCPELRGPCGVPEPSCGKDPSPREGTGMGHSGSVVEGGHEAQGLVETHSGQTSLPSCSGTLHKDTAPTPVQPQAPSSPLRTCPRLKQHIPLCFQSV